MSVGPLLQSKQGLPRVFMYCTYGDMARSLVQQGVRTSPVGGLVARLRSRSATDSVGRRGLSTGTARNGGSGMATAFCFGGHVDV